MKDYVFWYANDSFCNFDHLIDYIGCDKPQKRPIFFNQKVDKTKNNIFFISGDTLDSALDVLLDYKDEIEWCDANGITVIFDHIWESLRICVPSEEAIDKVKAIIPKKFKILCNITHADDHLIHDPMYSYWLKYVHNVEFFPMFLGYQMELMKRDPWNVINPSKSIKRKYLFSLLCGEIAKFPRAITLAGLMEEGLLDNSFYTTYLRYDTRVIMPNKFKHTKYLKNNYDKIMVNKLFDFPDIIDNKQLSPEILYGDKDFRIPVQMHQSYFNIVFETFSHDVLCFFTEKTFKPIAAEKPFIIFGTFKQNQYLESLGFKIFPEIFNYSFEDPEFSVNKNKYHFCELFINEIKRVSTLPLSVFDQPSILAKIEHNKNLLNQLSSRENTYNNLIELFS